MAENPVTITKFINAIRRLPSDEPIDRPGVWYRTQKEHWLGWLGNYDGPGAYGRINWNRDAKFAYNHVVCPELLLYLIRAIPLDPETVAAAEVVAKNGKSLMEKAGAIRRVVPWEMIHQALWGENNKTRFPRMIFHRKKF